MRKKRERLQATGTTRPVTKKITRTNWNKDYAFYRRYFMQNPGSCDIMYNKLKSDVIDSGRKLAVFMNRIMIVVEMFGKPEEINHIKKIFSTVEDINNDQNPQ